jgi:RNA recognition motif-containing protein
LSQYFSSGKRQREADQTRKRKEKEEMRAARRARGPASVEIADASEMQRNLPSIESALSALGNRSPESRAAAGVPVRLFVGSLPDEVTEHDLREVFGAHGRVVDAAVVKDRVTQAPRGFGFVTMSNRREAAKAVEALEGSELKNRTIVVNIATERSR